MSDTKPTEHIRLFPEEALADIRTLARFALESGDITIMKRDMEMILTIAEMALPPRSDHKTAIRSGRLAHAILRAAFQINASC